MFAGEDVLFFLIKPADNYSWTGIAIIEEMERNCSRRIANFRILEWRQQITNGLVRLQIRILNLIIFNKINKINKIIKIINQFY